MNLRNAYDIMKLRSIYDIMNLYDIKVGATCNKYYTKFSS